MKNETSPFGEIIRSISGSKIFFEPLKGNNGDRLIHMGMLELFKQASITPCSNPEDCEIIVINGGGAMNDIWPEGAAQVLGSYLDRFPYKRIIVGPSSYLFRTAVFAEILNKATARVMLFCREKQSIEFLQSLELGKNIDMRLSRDLAFELEGSEFIREQLIGSAMTQVLCAMRKDREGAGGVLAKTGASWLPMPLRRPLSKIRDRLVARRSSNILDPIMNRISPGVAPGEVFYRDVSVSVDFQDFCENIRKSRAIITNRLHIAILGSLLEKEVHLVRGNYHKIAGVYDFSLKDNPKIFLY